MQTTFLMTDAAWTDTNLRAASLLGDMAAVQTDPHKRRGYAHAAAAIRDLPEQLDVLADGADTLPRIARVGPSSARIVLEVLATGGSALVERAVVESGKHADIARRRALRDGFLSRAAALAVLGAAGRYDGYTADFQMHSTWSDGRESVAAMAAACKARSYTHAAMTDHAVGLPIAGGQSAEGFARQRREIDALNDALAGRFRMLRGVEANIDGVGALDVSEAQRREFDLVVAAVHSGLRAADDQTARLLGAVTAPGVHVLGHPRGRQFGTRGGVRASWPRIFRAAASRQVAIELDGDPARQDLDAGLAVQALDAGCLFALDSDAHAAAELGYVDMAMAHARLAGIPAERIVNCWPLDRLLAWLADRRS